MCITSPLDGHSAMLDLSESVDVMRCSIGSWRMKDHNFTLSRLTTGYRREHTPLKVKMWGAAEPVRRMLKIAVGKL